MVAYQPRCFWLWSCCLSSFCLPLLHYFARPFAPSLPLASLEKCRKSTCNCTKCPPGANQEDQTGQSGTTSPGKRGSRDCQDAKSNASFGWLLPHFPFPVTTWFLPKFPFGPLPLLSGRSPPIVSILPSLFAAFQHEVKSALFLCSFLLFYPPLSSHPTLPVFFLISSFFHSDITSRLACS